MLSKLTLRQLVYILAGLIVLLIVLTVVLVTA